jgi:glutamate synthase domain-containing protein 3
MDNFKNEQRNFIKVMPLDYKKVLEGKKPEVELELAEVSDG